MLLLNLLLILVGDFQSNLLKGNLNTPLKFMLYKTRKQTGFFVSLFQLKAKQDKRQVTE